MSFFYIFETLPNNKQQRAGPVRCFVRTTAESPRGPVKFPEAAATWEEPQNTLCFVHKSQGLIFVGSWLPSEGGGGVEWKNEAGVETNSGVGRDVWPSLKQSYKSADWHGESGGGSKAKSETTTA